MQGMITTPFKEPLLPMLSFVRAFSESPTALLATSAFANLSPQIQVQRTRANEQLSQSHAFVMASLNVQTLLP